MAEITIPKPDDWHLHLRDGAMLEGVLPYSARHFARAIIMPNLVPPVVTSADAKSYRDRIMAALPSGLDFTPLMTLYLTEGTDAADVASAHASGLVTAVKLYPAGATTNSHSGVRDLAKVMPVLEKMAEIGMPLCIHGEVTDPAVDIFDREAVFIETVLDPLRRKSAAASFLRVREIEAIPDDGVPRQFPIVTDRVDAWTGFPAEPVGAVYLRREKGSDVVQALSATCPHAG